MPWEVTNPVIERERFIAAYLTGAFSIRELADRFGVSRRTLYKWLARHDVEGLRGLEDRSRAPHSCPHRTDPKIEADLVAYRKRFPLMGPRKIVARLHELQPWRDWPSASTAGAILERHGLIEDHPPRGRRAAPPPRRPAAEAHAPNDVMTTDYKGEFLLGDHTTCYPLTLADLFSRFIIGLDALTSNEYAPTRAVFERVFREFGLPLAMRSDNGSPFGSPGLGRLSRLSLWFLRLGITLQRIVPGHPEQNAEHERMHRTLKRHTARPPAATLRAQQRRFDEFREFFNDERPHEALGQRRPATVYTPSPRPYPETLPPIEYPGHYEVRRVDDRGQLRFRDERIFFSHTFAHEYVAFDEIDDGLWSVYYGPVLVARYDEQAGKFHEGV